MSTMSADVNRTSARKIMTLKVSNHSAGFWEQKPISPHDVPCNLSSPELDCHRYNLKLWGSTRREILLPEWSYIPHG
ncbi:hypothetical protein J6590_092638 [Homalodisca vitripennis]|nr:hypothetical protein J6590_092638 [Homalodisca vitripennis]